MQISFSFSRIHPIGSYEKPLFVRVFFSRGLQLQDAQVERAAKPPKLATPSTSRCSLFSKHVIRFVENFPLPSRDYVERESESKKWNEHKLHFRLLFIPPSSSLLFLIYFYLSASCSIIKPFSMYLPSALGNVWLQSWNELCEVKRNHVDDV